MKLPAISVDQPIGTFYICLIPYKILEQVAFPDALTLTDAGAPAKLLSINRCAKEFIKERRRKIGDYISTAEATFPNTIILAANITKDGSILEDDENSSSSRWTIEYDENCKIYWLTIPDTSLMLARIIDGQHRVRGFKYSVEPRPENFELPCSVFLDMSMPEQASIFATININQTRVDGV
ncbi:MAG: DGQHR domain-containing protein [Flavobacteriales bacterium]|nr:DGQHR domain-containing protein [Flavobacteriales bacterium]